MRKWIFILALGIFCIPAISFAQISVSDTGLIVTGDQVFGDNYLQEEVNESIGSYLGARIINPLFGLLGVIFLVLMIYAGILWMTSGGNKEQVQKAKHILVNSTIGLVLILVAYAITQFVFTQLI